MPGKRGSSANSRACESKASWSGPAIVERSRSFIMTTSSFRASTGTWRTERQACMYRSNRLYSRWELIRASSRSIFWAVDCASASAIAPELWLTGVVRLNAPSSTRRVGCKIGTAAQCSARRSST